MKKFILTLLVLAATALCGTTYAEAPKDDKAVAAEKKESKEGEAKKEAEPAKKDAKEGKEKKAKKETKEAKADKPKKGGKATPYPLDTCMVTDNKLGTMGDEVTIVYEGKEIKFCCKPCETKFKKDPARYLPKLDK